ncbi:bifunctional diguanylate cyclase/phosphodiesterase [Oxynema sp. CENA135]|uniref:putative bifunctional diguanylate cyclase/phosphodiesterase n=1 Tax=Oxynema sp. CENA135 TaxID=984206 RepID=UPI001F2E5B47|nr:EAL domain-containing response regulator [Oxynema sp. CENA135]
MRSSEIAASYLQPKSMMKTILVIEDEEFVRANILEILDSMNFETLGAENGKIGVELAQQHLPDLILCDIKMPELDGYGVLTELRQDPTTATIPFIFLTAKAEVADLRQGMNLGADDYLTKPFRRAELLSAVSVRLEKQAAMQQRYSHEKQELIASLQQVKARLNDSVHYDPLTKLPNQLLLREQFDRIETQAERGQQPIPILYIGLDRFSRIVETLGHALSDRLIQEVARRLLSCVNPDDTVAHLNGERFAIVQSPFSQNVRPNSLGSDRLANGDARPCLPLVEHILETMARPFLLDRHEIFMTVSIGIGIYPIHARDIDNLMKRAGAAMSRAQQLGGNQYEFYNPSLTAHAIADLNLETSLRYALERSEFLVYYQPQVELKTGKIAGAEALVRWQHPEKGLVSPGKFIPLAEEIGLIVPIGQWVLQTACSQIQQWQARGLFEGRLAINLSIRQFNQPDLVPKLAEILETTGLEPSTLEIEVTESLLVQNIDNTIAKLKAIKALGMTIALDDFGTGYSSLSYLQQFPFDILKIDRCFVRNLPEDRKNAAIATAILQMAHGLNLKVVAEGVETYQELLFLYGQECDTLQGYLFSPPISTSEFETLLRTGKKLKLPETDDYLPSY